MKHKEEHQEETDRLEAEKKVKHKMAFYKQVQFFLIFNTLFLFFSRGRLLYITIIWGLGLLLYYLFEFHFKIPSKKEWEKAEFERELNKIKDRRSKAQNPTEPKDPEPQIRPDYKDSDLL